MNYPTSITFVIKDADALTSLTPRCLHPRQDVSRVDPSLLDARQLQMKNLKPHLFSNLLCFNVEQESLFKNCLVGKKLTNQIKNGIT